MQNHYRSEKATVCLWINTGLVWQGRVPPSSCPQNLSKQKTHKLHESADERHWGHHSHILRRDSDMHGQRVLLRQKQVALINLFLSWQTEKHAVFLWSVCVLCRWLGDHRCWEDQKAWKTLCSLFVNMPRNLYSQSTLIFQCFDTRMRGSERTKAHQDRVFKTLMFCWDFAIFMFEVPET